VSRQALRHRSHACWSRSGDIRTISCCRSPNGSTKLRSMDALILGLAGQWSRSVAAHQVPRNPEKSRVPTLSKKPTSDIRLAVKNGGAGWQRVCASGFGEVLFLLIPLENRSKHLKSLAVGGSCSGCWVWRQLRPRGRNSTSTNSRGAASALARFHGPSCR